MITITTPKPAPIIQWSATPAEWLNYFNPTEALRSFVAYIATLGSSKTPEQYTLRNYESGLKYFLAWVTNQPTDNLSDVSIMGLVQQPSLPLPDGMVMQEFIGHLAAKGLKASTIHSNYQIPVRHWLKALSRQHVPGVRGDVRDEMEDYRRAILNALDVKAPKSAESSNLSPLHRHGTRLKVTQINDFFASIVQDDSLTGKRDLAITYIGITSALRVAELSRITLNTISMGENCYEVRVRGKGGQLDPVAIDNQSVALIHAYVDAWNAALPDGEQDPRYIGKDTPIWQPTRANRPEDVGTNGYLSKKDKNGKIINKGISRNGLRKIIVRRAEIALGIKVTPHDLRRTYAARASEAGIPLTVISRQMRHANIATTDRYIGTPPNMGAALLTNHIQIRVG